MSAEDRRRELAKKAWSEAYARLAALAGASTVVGDAAATREILDAEKAANDATAKYVQGDPRANPRDALKRWESMVATAITAALDKRGCHDCGHEKVAEVVERDGHRSCGRCRAGIRDGKHVGG